MAETLCLGPLTAESEFQTVPATSSHPAAMLTGACGPNAAASACRAASQSSTTPNTLTAYRTMRGLGLGESNGVSNLWDLEQTAKKFGYRIALPASGESVLAFCARATLSRWPVVLFITNGQAFVDYLTGSGMDASNLQGHFVALLGRNTGGASARTSKTLPVGYWVADGDNNVQNPIVSGRRVHRGLNSDLVYYSDTTIARAQPAGAFAVLPVVGTSAGTGGTQAVAGTVKVPYGWHDDGTTLTAPNGVAVVHGFRAYVLANGWDMHNVPLVPEFADSAGISRQDFLWSSLGWTQSQGVYALQTGKDIVAMRAQIKNLKTQLAAAQAQAAQASGPAEQKSLAAIQAIKAAIGEL